MRVLPAGSSTIRHPVAILVVLWVLGCSEESTGPRPVPTAIRIVTGDLQQGTAGQPLDTALTLLVTDKFGDPVPGVLVRFATPAGAGSVDPVTSSTGADGQATAVWTLPTRAGNFAVSAVASGFDSVSYRAVARADQSATITLVQGDSQTTLVGQPLERTVAVWLQDQYGNDVPSISVSFTPDRGSGAARTPLGVTGADGRAASVWVLGDSAGPMTLTVAVSGLAPLTASAAATYVSVAPVPLALGPDHSCAIAPGGLLRCWGANRAGEVDPASTVPIYRPMVAGSGLTVRSVAAGYNHTCVIADDGQTYCWGQYGMTGTSLRGGGPEAAVVEGNHRFLTLSAGYSHSCGVDPEGAGWCWGWNDRGQLGDGTIGGFSLVPAPVQGEVRFAWISAGGSFSCGLSRRGEVYCWGANDKGQLGLDHTSDTPVPAPLGNPVPFRALSAGGDHACGLTLRDQAYCWGSNAGAKLGGGGSEVPERLTRVEGRFTGISAGGEHSCGVTRDQSLYCWGGNYHGAVGSGVSEANYAPVLLQPGGFTAVATGSWHSCALTAGGSVYCWGDNGLGQTGHGESLRRVAPEVVVGGVPFVDLTGGADQTCGRSTTGQIYCWGNNGSGQAGLLNQAWAHPSPELALDGARVEQLSAGYGHSCGILTAGGAACWGQADYLGADDPSASPGTPVRVAGAAGYLQVQTGFEESCGLLGDSTVACWAAGRVPEPAADGLRFANLAVGGEVKCGLTVAGEAYCWTRSRPVPTRIGGRLRFSEVQSGLLQTCGLGTDSTAYCWGPELDPAAVSTTLRFRDLDIGYRHACGLSLALSAFCWGDNSFGQLGDGTGMAREAPTPVAGGHRFVSLTTGGYHSCGVTEEHAAWCWGQNSDGQLGAGISRLVPVPTVVY